MNKLTPFAVIGFVTLIGSAQGANYSMEARSDAMGGTGTASANYLTAPFFNPAIAAIYRRNDDLGILAPSFGIIYDDQDDLLDKIDAVSDAIDSTNITDIQNALNAVNGIETNIEVGGGAAIGLPNRYLAMTAYGKFYLESFINPVVGTNPTGSDSYVSAVSVGIAEAGISLAKYQTYMYQHVALGITPKLQRIYTYSYAATFNGFDTSDIRENETAETMFNLDAGALWFFGPWRLGFTAKNLMGRDVKTKEFTSGAITIDSYDYSMRPLYTIGGGIVADYFTWTVDYDLNEEKKFSAFNDNSQVLRTGIEFDLLRQLKIRAGYMKNMAQSDKDGTITAGVGISPLKLIEVDVAARYTNENAMGFSVNFLTTY